MLQIEDFNVKLEKETRNHEKMKVTRVENRYLDNKIFYWLQLSFVTSK